MTLDEIKSDWTLVAVQRLDALSLGWNWRVDDPGRLVAFVRAGKVGTVHQRRGATIELLAARVPAGREHLFSNMQDPEPCGAVRRGPVRRTVLAVLAERLAA